MTADHLWRPHGVVLTGRFVVHGGSGDVEMLGNERIGPDGKLGGETRLLMSLMTPSDDEARELFAAARAARVLFQAAGVE